MSNIRTRNLSQEEIDDLLAIVYEGTDKLVIDLKTKKKILVPDHSSDVIVTESGPEIRRVRVSGGTRSVRMLEAEAQKKKILYELVTNPPTIVEDVTSGRSSYPLFKKRLIQRLQKMQIESGENVGSRSTDALSQPLTQMTLDSHRSAAGGKKFTDATARINEILRVLDKIQNKNMRIHFKNKNMSFDEVMGMRAEFTDLTISSIADSRDVELLDEVLDIINTNPTSIMYRTLHGINDDVITSNEEVMSVTLSPYLLYKYGYDVVSFTELIRSRLPSSITVVPSRLELEVGVRYILYFFIDERQVDDIDAFRDNELRWMIDSSPLSGVLGIERIVPDSIGVGILIDQVIQGSYEIGTITYPSAIIMDKVSCLNYGIDARRLQVAFANIWIKTALSPTADWNDYHNLNNYVLYVDDPDPKKVLSDIYSELRSNKDESVVNMWFDKIGDPTVEEEWNIIRSYIPSGDLSTVIRQNSTKLIDMDRYYFLDTEGSNILHVNSNRFVDSNMTTSNNLFEVYATMGVEGYRTVAVREINIPMKSAGGFINQHHVELYVDGMSKTGVPLSADAKGLEGSGAGLLSVAAKASALQFFSEASIYGHVEPSSRYSAAIATGQLASVGSGTVSVIPDEEAMSQAFTQAFPDVETRRQQTIEMLNRLRGDRSVLPPTEAKISNPLAGRPSIKKNISESVRRATSKYMGTTASNLIAMKSEASNISRTSQLASQVDRMVPQAAEAILSSTRYSVNSDVNGPMAIITNSNTEESRMLQSRLAESLRLRYPLTTWSRETLPPVRIPDMYSKSHLNVWDTINSGATVPSFIASLPNIVPQSGYVPISTNVKSYNLKRIEDQINKINSKIYVRQPSSMEPYSVGESGLMRFF